MSKKNPRTTDTHEGKKLNIAGGDYRIIVSGEDTSGEYAMIEMTVPPGGGPPPHAHADFEEIFYVVEGEVHFRSESGSFIAQKGATVAIPRGGIIHNFKNKSDQTATLLCTVIPAGLDQIFIESAEYMALYKGQDQKLKEAMASLFEKYGQQLYPPDYWEKS